MSDPSLAFGSNLVLWAEGDAPPVDLVIVCEKWLKGEGPVGEEYPCMDCGPNLFLRLNDKEQWVVHRYHDTTCPANNGVLQKLL